MVKYGIPIMASSGHVAQSDDGKCKACGTCVNVCPFSALSLNQDHVIINWNKCLAAFKTTWLYVTIKKGKRAVQVLIFNYPIHFICHKGTPHLDSEIFQISNARGNLIPKHPDPTWRWGNDPRQKIIMQLQKAERRQAVIKLAIQGPSGSGKTYSSLRLANGLGGN